MQSENNTIETKFRLSFTKWLEAKQIKRLTSISELIEEYESEYNIKHTRRSYEIAMRKAKNLNIKRYEQLYVIPLSKSETISMDSTQLESSNIEKIHEAHKLAFSIKYTGSQPSSAIFKNFGRYRTAKQYIFKINNITIVAFIKTLNIWVHFAKGIRTRDQIINARKEAYKTLMQFAKEKNIIIDGYLEKILLSHHVIVHNKVNDALKGTVKEYEQDIYNKIGTHVCPSSHKGLIEHEGKMREDKKIKGEDIASGLEYLLLNFPNDFSKVAQQQNRYDENIRAHLKAIEEMRDTMKAIRKILEKR